MVLIRCFLYNDSEFGAPEQSADVVFHDSFSKFFGFFPAAGTLNSGKDTLTTKLRRAKNSCLGDISEFNSRN